MSACNNCASNGSCKYRGSSQLYRIDQNTPVVALLGQPNSGKSTVFNMMTGSHQHVGNWPGKTVDQKEGEFKIGDRSMILADLPGSYSLSADSDEEVITRNYIESGYADLILVMADASQLRRSLYMLTELAGQNIPSVLVLNMMDVAKGQGTEIDVERLRSNLGIPVVPISAINKKDYALLYEKIVDGLDRKAFLKGSRLVLAQEKIRWIDETLQGVLTESKTSGKAYTKFDKIALAPVRGKFLAIGIILLVFLVSMIFAGVVGSAAALGLGLARESILQAMTAMQIHALLISLVCDVLLNVLYFAIMMATFVLGKT